MHARICAAPPPPPPPPLTRAHTVVYHKYTFFCQYYLKENDKLLLHSFSSFTSSTVPPIVKVSPHSQIEPSMMDVKVRCHAEGVPKPTISWQINNVALPKDPHHYELEGKYVMTICEQHVQGILLENISLFKNLSFCLIAQIALIYNWCVCECVHACAHVCSRATLSVCVCVCVCVCVHVVCIEFWQYILVKNV